MTNAPLVPALAGRTALVTGSGRNIGRAIALSLAREFGPDGITANTVAPGAIDTVREIPLGRFGKPDEVAATCDLLCSEPGGLISGQVIHVNGGHYMY